MIRVLLYLCAALFAGAVIHIVTIFAVPFVATNDIWSRAVKLGPEHQIYHFTDPHAALEFFPKVDPSFAYGLCRANVAKAPVRLSGTLPSPFWSASYIDTRGRNRFSLTNQTSGSNLDIMLATKGQQRLLTERPDLMDETTISINTVGTTGLLVLRVFVPGNVQRSEIHDALAAVTCKPLWEDVVPEQ